MIQHVELGNDQRVESVDHGGIAEQRRIKPSASTRTPRNRAEFLAFAAQQIARGVESLGRERSRAHTGDVSFRNSDHAVMRVGGTPVPVQAPPAVALDDVTNGYVPWSISSMVPCAPSNKMRLPWEIASPSNSAVSHTIPDRAGVLFGLFADLRVVHRLVEKKTPGEEAACLQRGLIQRTEGLRVEQIRNADPAASNFVFVTGADAARGGPDGNTVLPRFRHLFDQPVERKNHVRAIADAQMAGDVYTGGFQLSDLAEQRLQIDHHAIPDHGLHARAQNFRTGSA